MKRHLGAILLLITTLFWGGGFVGQKYGADHLGTASVIFFRSVFAAAFLLLVQLARRRGGFARRTIVAGVICGVSLFIPMVAQQLAFDADVSPGVCAFLTANYMLLVPVFGLAVGRRASRAEWLALIPALIGTYFICVKSGESFAIGSGELLTLLCAALFAVEILVVDRFAPGTDAIALSIVMFATCAVCATPLLLLPSEASRLSQETVMNALPALLFLGVGSSGIGYTFQNVAQGMRTPPTLASIIMSLESVFGALFGWWFCDETFTGRVLFGCALVFLAALGAELAHVLGKSRLSLHG